MIKKIVLFGVGLFVAFSALIVFQRRSLQQNEDVLLIGTVSGYAPFVSVNEQGEYEGFDVDVAYALAERLNKKLVLQDLGSMTSLLMALEQGSIDAAIWALSIIPERLKKIAMVKYQGEVTVSYPLIFWKSIPLHVANIFDMQGMTVCVEPNSSQDEVLKKYDFITIQPTEKVDDALLNIQYGKVDAAFVEPAIAKKFKAKYPEIQILDVELDPEDQVLGMGIAIKKDNFGMINDIEKAIKQLRQEGIIQEYENKWGVE